MWDAIVCTCPSRESAVALRKGNASRVPCIPGMRHEMNKFYSPPKTSNQTMNPPDIIQFIKNGFVLLLV